MTGRLPVVSVGVDHRSASPRTVDRLHALRQRLGRAPAVPAGAGMVGLATCHRLELYFEGMQVEAARRAFADWSGVRNVPDGFTVRTGEEAARHLLRVTAGLESAVLGEDQILAQARRAYRDACRDGLSGPLLHRLFHASFRTGKRVRAETTLADGGRSLAGAAVAALNRDLGGLGDRSVLVVGTGEIGSLAARRLRGRGVGRLLVCNRTPARCRDLARELEAELLPWAWVAGALSGVDAVVCATGAPSPVVSASDLERAVRQTGCPQVVVDLSVPANVERPAPCPPPLRVVDVEELSVRLRDEALRRNAATAAAETIVEGELRDWSAWARARTGRKASMVERRLWGALSGIRPVPSAYGRGRPGYVQNR